MKDSIYEFDGKASSKDCLPVSFQHVFAMLIGNVAPALLVGQAAGLDARGMQTMICAAMLTAALATIIQVRGSGNFGAKLPLVMGLNFAFVPIAINVVGKQGLATIYPAMSIGGLVLIALGFGIKKIEKYFPPLVTGITVTTMGISLYPVAIDYMAGGGGNPSYGSMENWLVALVTLALVLFFSTKKGFLGINSMLVGIIGGYILASFFGMVDLKDVGESTWFALPRLLPFGYEVDRSVILTFAVMYIVTSVEALGDTSSLTIGGFDRTATSDELSGVVKGNGLASIIASLFGGLPTATFSQNVGIVSLTKAVNKKIIELASLIIFVGAFFPKFSALIASIPYPVLGGATLSVFAIITVNGMRLLGKAKFSQKNMTIIGVSLALGLGISQVPAAISGFPESFQTFFGSSPVIISTLTAFILNLVMKEED